MKCADTMLSYGISAALCETHENFLTQTQLFDNMKSENDTRANFQHN